MTPSTPLHHAIDGFILVDIFIYLKRLLKLTDHLKHEEHNRRLDYIRHASNGDPPVFMWDKQPAPKIPDLVFLNDVVRELLSKEFREELGKSEEAGLFVREDSERLQDAMLEE